MADLTVRDLTEGAFCDAVIATGGDGLRPNRVLAERLAVVHRLSAELLVSPSGELPPLSPEEKLLRAIFGEKATDQIEMPDPGALLYRGACLIGHRQGKVFFTEAASCVVEHASTETENLPPNVSERFRVTVTWPGPVTVGDVLLSDGSPLGVVTAIEEDGSSEPRLHAAESSSRAGRITRRFPSAAQLVLARNVGPYDPVTREPINGRELRLDQLEWLAEAGGRAIVSELATYSTGDVRQGPIAFEALIKGEVIAHGFRPFTSEEKS